MDFIEEKDIYVGTTQRKEEEIKVRQVFGWKYIKDEHHGRTHALHIVLKRNRDIPNYSRLTYLEREYDECKKQLRTYFPITDSPEMFLLILLLIFPFVIYCVYKSNQKKEIKENNERLHQKMDRILEMARTLK